MSKLDTSCSTGASSFSFYLLLYFLRLFFPYSRQRKLEGRTRDVVMCETDVGQNGDRVVSQIRRRRREKEKICWMDGEYQQCSRKQLDKRGTTQDKLEISFGSLHAAGWIDNCLRRNSLFHREAFKCRRAWQPVTLYLFKKYKFFSAPGLLRSHTTILKGRY